MVFAVLNCENLAVFFSFKWPKSEEFAFLSRVWSDYAVEEGIYRKMEIKILHNFFIVFLIFLSLNWLKLEVFGTF